MAITDNSFTADEIAAAIEANADLIPLVTGALTSKKYFVANKAEKTAYDTNLENGLKLTLEPGIKQSARDEYEVSIFESVKEITGLERAEGETLAQYQARALKSDITDVERQQLVSLKEIASTSKTEITTLKNQHQSEITKLKAENSIFSQIGKVDVKLNKEPLLQDAIEIVKAKTIEDMTKAAKFEKVDGVDKMVFYGADKKPILNATTGEIATAEEVYEIRMSKFLVKAPVKLGAGGGEDGPDNDITPGSIKTQTQLTTMLEAKGLVAGTLEYTKEYNRLGGAKLPFA